jgi:hypothetical protein
VNPFRGGGAEVAENQPKQGVGYTAFFVATIRAAETGRERPLFHDPYARLFTRDDVDVAVRSLPFFATVARCRTVWFDDAVRRAIDAGRSQVVILGAGFDSRALRLARPGASFFEIDQPQVQAIKNVEGNVKIFMDECAGLDGINECSEIKCAKCGWFTLYSWRDEF